MKKTKTLAILFILNLALCALSADKLNAKDNSIEAELDSVVKDSGIEFPALNRTVPAPKPAVAQKAKSFSAMAANELFANGKGSYFNRLKELYGKGKLPDTDKLIGWFTGRCYHVADPCRPTPKLLAGLRSQDNGDNGPLFPSQHDLKLFQFIADPSDPNAYDELSEREITDIESSLRQDANWITHAIEINGSLVTWHRRNNLKYRIRSYKSYFIAEYAVLDDVKDRFKSGDVVTMCYFFKKVHE
ncbi:hypothetical protein ACFL6Y_11475 [Elusimicrobiota bacterium]